MIRKPAAASSKIVATIYPVPAWLRDDQIVASDPPFAAGAALAALDRVMREEPPWRGVWIQRLVLRAAAGACRHFFGRTEDEAALRDLWMLRAPASGFGPAGAVLKAYHQLATADPLQDPVIKDCARGFGLDGSLVEPGLGAALAGLVKGRAALTAAADAAATVDRHGGRQAEVLALWAADAVLAKTLGWPVAPPLHSGSLLRPRRGARPRPRPRPGEPEWMGFAAVGVTEGAIAAVDLANEMARRADKLQSAATKVRTKRADRVIEALLREDAVTPASLRGKLSDRAARRLFDRLVLLGGVRELSGRQNFRIYGL